MDGIPRFYRWSGLTCIVGGVLFPIAIAIHLLRDGKSVNDSPYSAIHVLIGLAIMLLLYGLIGLYFRQAEKVGPLPFTLAFVGTLWTFGLIVQEGFSWPAVGFYNPEAVHNFDPALPAPRGSSLFVIFIVGLLLFAIGYIVFGAATRRAGILPGFAGILVAVGGPIYALGAPAIFTLGPASILVTVIEAVGAILFGAGFAWFGYRMRDERAKRAASAAPA